ncbi:conserved exported hypothetical protein [Vibrio coralliirubri]|uniref:hypothetical protein n=1 Tax=Vibrio coralliirubri TaxID=1516159 RepID=UPI00063544B8|nr:hypothetical protein [Vibrio coralliirubri]CDT67785.1 conserved exported hypothetical protein [Vibrio coralliirubri]
MQINKAFFRQLFLLSLLASFNADAIQLNTMLSIFDESGEKPAFTVTNNDGLTLFVRTDIAEITVDNNEVIETPYTSDNIQDWRLNTTPSKLMLMNGQSKNVYADFLCNNGCSAKRDSVFRVSFIPQPYVDPDKKSEKSTVSLLVGFAPLLVVPASDPIIDYDYQVDKAHEQVRFNNKGTTLLHFSINACTPAKLRDGEQCQISYPVLAGRDRFFTIPSNILNSAKKITVVNHDESFIKTNGL